MGCRGWRDDDRGRHAGVPARRAGGRRLSRRQVPARLPGLVDSHAHLQHARFDHDREAVLDRAVEAGIGHLLVPGWDLASSHGALELAARHPGLVVAGVGVHPHHAAEMSEADWSELESLADDRRAVAIGEIGLDFHRNLSPPAVQREALARQLALAAERGLPVLVHDREAHAEIGATLLEWTEAGPGVRRGVLHAFSGDAAMALCFADAGWCVSFALPVAFRSAVGPRAAAATLPEGSFLVETDAPYLGPDREARNEPTTALRVAAEVARLREVRPEEIGSAVAAAWTKLLSRASEPSPDAGTGVATTGR